MMRKDDDRAREGARPLRRPRRGSTWDLREPPTPRPALDLEPYPHLELEPCREGPGFRVFQIFPRTTFAWGNVVGGGLLSYDLSPYIPLTDTPEAIVVVRVHEIAMTVGQLARLELQLVSLSRDDPETIFVSGLHLVHIVVDASTQSGICLTGRLRADLGTHLRSVLHLRQATNPASASVTLSAELLARTTADTEACSCSPA